MKYFITSDIHSFYTLFIQSLEAKGFEKDNPDHILILCGDAFDRGDETLELLNFLLYLKEKERLIYIKGNHEYLLMNCLDELYTFGALKNPIHASNGTAKTIGHICGIDSYVLLFSDLVDASKIKNKMKPITELINTCVNYYELGDNIFVHGWIPHVRDYEGLKEASNEEWEKASWSNGMAEWNDGWKLDKKTIWCGHWHTSWGNYRYHGEGSGEFEEDSSFDPFIDYGIIALDACTAYTKKVNVITLQGE